MNTGISDKGCRKTGQYLLPEIKQMIPEGTYDIYPSFKIGDDLISSGFESLAEKLLKYKTIIIEGYTGVFYDHFQNTLDIYLKKSGAKVSWFKTSDFLKPENIIEELVAPFTGGDDPLFGCRTNLCPGDFFDLDYLKKIRPDPHADISLIIGPGASLAGWKGLLVYIDLPKNEIQYRSRAGAVTNLGATASGDPAAMYKRYFFVDWIVLNDLKKSLLPAADLIIDGQNPGNPAWMTGDTLRRSVSVMSRNVFRVRPWFEPGTWGGTWIMDHIPGLNKNVPNYAWSFELIVPENGLLLESSGRLLEVSFDTLMFLEGEAVLGDSYLRFGTDFPIRFDFLDTFDGGNLSIQCHPRPDYIKKHFGEPFTQEETYYILNTGENAAVYLGFQKNIDPEKFRTSLEISFRDSIQIDIERFVQKHHARKHDLFLIPYGTVHGSGKNNLVLEISSTPYIYTFKMYDWLRPGLEGKLRPLNIPGGMENLNFDRKGDLVKDELISNPVLIDQGTGWQLWHLPTHETHFYDVHRYHFKDRVAVKTENKFHVLSLVEGTSIIIETENGIKQKFSYAETFVIPAAAGSYRIINNSSSEAMVIKACVK